MGQEVTLHPPPAPGRGRSPWAAASPCWGSRNRHRRRGQSRGLRPSQPVVSDSLQAHSLSKPAKFPPPECLPVKEGPEPPGDTAVGPATPDWSNREAGAAPGHPRSGCACLLLPASCPPIPQAPPHHSQSVQFSRSVVSDSETPWTAACQASLSITNSWSLLKLVHRVSDAIPPSHPLSSPSPASFSLSQHQGLFQ